MSKFTKLGRRTLFAFVALLLGGALTVPALFSPGSAAADQVLSRSITMSSSQASATGVTYTVQFTPSSNTLGAVVVDFCDNDPLVGESTCSVPANFSLGATPTVTPGTNMGTGSDWTEITALNNGQGVIFGSTSATGETITGGSLVNFTITGVTNPSVTDHSFYARIVTFDTNAHAVAEYTTNAGTGRQAESAFTDMIDYGGIALSTTSNIEITAKVFETLNFCVFNNAGGTGNCGDAPSIALGDSSTGALSASTAYVNSDAAYKVATNAGNGISVYMRGTTLCRTPNTPANCATGASAFTITAVGSATNVVSVPGTEQFGMCVDTTGGNGGLEALNEYADTTSTVDCHGIATGAYAPGTPSNFGFDDNSTTGTTSPTGSEIMSSTGAIQSYTGGFTFLGNIAVPTEAGLYQTSLNLVATATF